jgi:hypothetical protein
MIGASVDMDLGTGTPERVPLRDLGDEISVSGSLDGFGVRQMTFSRYGREQSLWRSRMIQNMASVTLTGYRGTPGSVASTELFNGWVREADFESDTGITTYTCQDVSLPFVDQELFLDVEIGSGQTRKQIVEALFTSLGWPQGTHDWPNDDGGYAFKGVSEGGDRRVSEWLVDYLVPIGRRARWKNGEIVVERFDTAEAATRTLGPGEIRSLTMTPPPTNAPNTVAMSANIYPYLGPGGRRTLTPVTVSTYGDITPEVAINVQNHTTGAITATGLTATPLTGVELTRIVTTDTVEGGALIQRVVQEYGWCAPVACNKKQDTSGVVSYNDDFDVYEFATSRSGLHGTIDTDSGYWRTQSAETFQLLRTTTTRYYFDNVDNGGLLKWSTTTVNELALIEMPSGTYVWLTLSTTPTPQIYYPCYMTDDKRAHIDGRETWVSYQYRRDYVEPAVDSIELTGWTEAYDYVVRSMRYPTLLSATEVADLGHVVVGVNANGADVLFGYGRSTERRPFPMYREVVLDGVTYPASEFLPLHFFWRGASYAYGRIWPTNYSEEPSVWSGSVTLNAIDATSHYQSWTLSYEARTALAASGLMQAGLLATNGLVPAVASYVNDVMDGALPEIDVVTEGQPPRPTTITVVDSVRKALADAIAITEYRSSDYCETRDQLNLAGFDVLREYAPRVQIETDWYHDIGEGSIIAVKDARLGASTAVKLLVQSFSASLNQRTAENSMTLDCVWFPAELLSPPALPVEVLE